MSDNNNNNNGFNLNMSELFGVSFQNQRNQFQQLLKTELEEVQSNLQMAQNEVIIMESELKIARNKLKLLGLVIENVRANICKFKSEFAVNSVEEIVLEELGDFGLDQPHESNVIISADAMALATDVKQMSSEHIGLQLNLKGQIDSIGAESCAPKFVSFSSGVKEKIEFYNELSK